MELDPSDPLIQTIRAAWQLMIERDFEGGVARHEEAFQKNPNSVWICGGTGFAHCLCRQPDRALERIERARRLSPHDSSMFLWLPGGAIAHLLAGRPQEAIRWTEDALQLNPRHLISLLLRAAAEVAAQRETVAREFVERMRAIDQRLDLKFASGCCRSNMPRTKSVFYPTCEVPACRTDAQPLSGLCNNFSHFSSISRASFAVSADGKGNLSIQANGRQASMIALECEVSLAPCRRAGCADRAPSSRRCV